MISKDKYSKSIIEACNEMKLDYFPQVEASELLYRVITLEDIYLPLTLDTSFSNIDIDEIIRRIDNKLAALDEEEARYIASSDTEESDTLFNQEDQDTITSVQDVGLRLLIVANPGSGKTTFCKRLVLAMLKNEDSFFKKYSEENNLVFNLNALPVLISCKNIADLSVNEIETIPFPQLLYKLCLHSFGLHFSEITEKEFMELIGSYESKALCIILDGWDEILDTEKEAAFSENLNSYLNIHPLVDTVITIRDNYVAPEISNQYSERYIICPLSENDIREFCKKWYEVILSSDQQRAKNYSLIADQILSSKEQQVRLMMKNPLDLSLLLTVSKNDGRLPENKAELFKELVNLYIFWSTNKSTGALSAKSIRVFLAYIASIFTKTNKLYCDEKELLRIINQAIIDLEGDFSEDISCFDPYSIAKELSHTGILTMTRTNGGKRFSFSESTQGTHRQMQEYLTAYAILAQYSDEEYNNMQPIEIFEDKYGIRRWREIIIFIALMNNGRLRQDIIKNLISKAEENPENNYVYTNLLFDLIVNGTSVRLADKHKIYDIIFSKHITDQQIANIILLVTSNNRNSADFKTYINTMFAESVKNGDSEYGYALAMIEASIALQQGKSPFVHAEALLKTNQDVNIVAASQILTILAWCKYAKVINAFSSYSAQYKMSSEWIEIYKSLLDKHRVTTPLLKSIREAVLADFASFYDFFNDSDIINSCLNIGDSERAEDCEIILSIVPIFEYSNPECVAIDTDVKNKYLLKLNEEIDRKDYDEIIFTFGICASMGCFTLAEREEKWKDIDKIYKALNNDGYIGKARYTQLRKSLKPKELPQLMEQLESDPQISSKNPELFFPMSFWEMIEWHESYAIYSLGTEKMKITFPAGGLSQDAQRFLSSTIPASISTKNNLAYLLRRHELETISRGTDFSELILPVQLLEEGIREFEEFSVINYALSISGVYANEKGSYSIGKEYLTSVKMSLYSKYQNWTSVVNWWSNLLLQRNEYEGLVVLTWLFTLGFLELDRIDHQTLSNLSTKLKLINSTTEDFVLLYKAILDRIE